MAGKLFDFKAKSEQPFKIRSKTATKAEIILYASIGESWWGDSVSAKQFSDEMKALDPAVNELDVRINSPGGDVFDGIAIYNRLCQFKGTVNVYIDGLCASIASIIALAGDTVTMGEGALYMVHLPWTFAMGNRDDLENTVDLLRNIEEQMLSIYSKATSLDRETLRQMLVNETWLDADQAIEKGFVDKKSEDSVPIAASVFDKAKWINKAPRNYNSETKVISAGINDLKKRIDEKLKARN
jgi:ATP-dependent Clp protease protease subunit